MWKRICRPRCYPALVTAASLVVGACAQAPPAPLGQLEVVGATAGSGACPAAGELRLQGLAGSALLVVSGAALCAGSPQRRELPSGLYSLTWQAALDGAPEPAGASPLQGPAVVSLLPGQLTRLRVQLEPREGSGTAVSQLSSTHAEPPSACSHGQPRSGAS